MKKFQFTPTSLIFAFCVIFFIILQANTARAWPCAATDNYVEERVKQSALVATGVAGEYTRQGTPLKLTHVYKTTEKELTIGSTVHLNKPYYSGWWAKLWGHRVISSNEPRFMAGTEYLIFADHVDSTETVVSMNMDRCSFQKTVAFRLAEIRSRKGDGASAALDPASLIFIGQVKKTYLLGGDDMTTTYTIVQFDVHELLNQVNFVKIDASKPLSVAVPACGIVDYFVFKVPTGGTYLAYATNSREWPVRLPFHAEEGKVPAEFGDVTLIMTCESLTALDEDLKLKKFSEDQKGSE